MIGRQSKIIKKYEYLIFTITIYCHSENSNNIFDTNGILLFDDCIFLLFYLIFAFFMYQTFWVIRRCFIWNDDQRIKDFLNKISFKYRIGRDRPINYHDHDHWFITAWFLLLESFIICSKEIRNRDKKKIFICIWICKNSFKVIITIEPEGLNCIYDCKNNIFNNL